MEYTTIDEKGDKVLGFDVVGKEYFIWNKLEHKWIWFKKLSEAQKLFDIMKGQKMIRIQYIKTPIQKIKVKKGTK